MNDGQCNRTDERKGLSRCSCAVDDADRVLCPSGRFVCVCVRVRVWLCCADANEMFRVCARFNALFIRPRIAAAVHDYQEQLIATVKKDISVWSQQRAGGGSDDVDDGDGR
jgi:hypothetical protein